MYHIALISEMAALACAATTFYWHWVRSAKPESDRIVSDFDLERLIKLQTLHGYNPHSLVGILENSQIWLDFKTQSGLCHTEHGKIRLVAAEMLVAEKNVEAAVSRFVEQTHKNGKIPVFLPVTEKFARAVVPLGFEAFKIGASPYFDLQTWNPRGNRAKNMRSGINRAKRAGVSVTQIFERDLNFSLEALNLSEKWLQSRRAEIKFGWLFNLSPLRCAEHKKFFVARNTDGKMVGLLAASPIPSRDGWYLEDILHDMDSPNGTTDLLVHEALKSLAADGAKIATLGTVPLAEDGADLLSGEKHFLTRKILNFSRANLHSVYNFDGLRHFKNKFVPDWWESEYVLFPKGFFVPPRTAHAFVQAILPDGLMPLALNKFSRIRPDKKVMLKNQKSL